jgi:hypothetical protein
MTNQQTNDLPAVQDKLTTSLSDFFKKERDRFGRVPVDHIMRVEGTADIFAASDAKLQAVKFISRVPTEPGADAMIPVSVGGCGCGSPPATPTCGSVSSRQHKCR